MSAELLFVGVDGGATKTTIRIERNDGSLIGHKIVGPSNLRHPVSKSWQVISLGIQDILSQQDISAADLHLGIGVAGCEIKTCFDEFTQYSHPFKAVCVKSDSYIACLGAHQGQDGAIIIVGTGCVGYQLQANEVTQVGGWGFPHDDFGSGAWIGLQAIQHSFAAIDKRTVSSTLTQRVLAHFDHDIAKLIEWANSANARQFAEFAPYVIQDAESDGEIGQRILSQAAQHIENLGIGLAKQQYKPLPLAIIGGISAALTSYFSPTFRESLVAAHSPPEVGAIQLIRNFLHERGT